MVKNFISAAEAHELTKTTQKPLNILFKRIKEEAGYGLSKIEHYVSEYDQTIVDSLTKALKEAKYEVTETCDENNHTVSLIICW